MRARVKPSSFRSLVYDWIRLTIPTLVVCGFLRWRGRRRGSREHDGLNLLVIRFDAIGDIVMSSAAMRELRRMYPTAHITLLADSRGFAVAETCPYADEVLCIPDEPTSIGFTVGRVVHLLQFCGAHFARRHYDIALVPRWDTDRDYATIISCFSQADRRVTFSRHCTKEKRLLNWGFGRYYTDILPPGELKHEVERGLDMVRYLGGGVSNSSTELWLTDEDKNFAEHWWGENGLAEFPVILACAPGATKAQCRWPARAFARLIERVNLLLGEQRVATLLICGPKEVELAREVLAGAGGTLFLPFTANVRQAAALIAKCSVLVGNNSGPIHIAAAAGIPVVEISCHPLNGDPSDELNPERFGAFSKESVVVQPRESIAPCTNKCEAWQQHCITAVTLEDVSEAVLTLLAERAGSKLASPCNS
jgi:ADP-heptose:LPS heptosyltransferase